MDGSYSDWWSLKRKHYAVWSLLRYCWKTCVSIGNYWKVRSFALEAHGTSSSIWAGSPLYLGQREACWIQHLSSLSNLLLCDVTLGFLVANDCSSFQCFLLWLASQFTHWWGSSHQHSAAHYQFLACLLHLPPLFAFLQFPASSSTSKSF